MSQSSTSHWSKLFKEQFMKLVQDGRNILEERQELSTQIRLITSQTVLHLVPQKVLIEPFHKEVTLPFSEELYKRNIDYFLEKDFSEYQEAKMISSLQSVLKTVWKSNLTKEERERLWKRIHVCLKISEKWHLAKIS